MKKVISFLFAAILLSSCISRRIDYIGASYPPTEQIDVFVHESAITKNYIIIGRIYVSENFWDFEKENVLKAVIKRGKATGANAVIFREGYTVPFPINDSLNVKQNRPQISSGHTIMSYYKSEILFLRYVQ